MGASTGNNCHTRVLCLGNDILADDALGIRVAEMLRERVAETVDVVTSGEAGLRLLDNLLDVSRVVVVDVMQTGQHPPGTVVVTDPESVGSTSGGSPHYLGLFDALAIGKRLGLPVARELCVVAVEAVDCTTVGGDMHPRVRRAVARVADLVEAMVK